jgi:hypothetical protein
MFCSLVGSSFNASRKLLKFGPKSEELTTDRRKLHNDELHNFYYTPNIIAVIKSKMMKWEWHVA